VRRTRRGWTTTTVAPCHRSRQCRRRHRPATPRRRCSSVCTPPARRPRCPPCPLCRDARRAVGVIGAEAVLQPVEPGAEGADAGLVGPAGVAAAEARGGGGGGLLPRDRRHTGRLQGLDAQQQAQLHRRPLQRAPQRLARPTPRRGRRPAFPPLRQCSATHCRSQSGPATLVRPRRLQHQRLRRLLRPATGEWRRAAVLLARQLRLVVLIVVYYVVAVAVLGALFFNSG
jgi:hypothetical protein